MDTNSDRTKDAGTRRASPAIELIGIDKRFGPVRANRAVLIQACGSARNLALDRMNKNSETFTFADVAVAFAKLAPQLPKLIRNNIRLSKASADDRLSAGRIFEEVAAKQPNKVFLCFEDSRWTYAEFNAWVNQLAHYFVRQGIRSGDCIALMFENCPELLACTLAAQKLGAIAGMLNHHQHGQALVHSITLVKPKMVIAGSGCTDAIIEIRSLCDPHISWHYFGEGAAHLPFFDVQQGIRNEPAQNLPQTQDVRLGDKCYYVFTSGTTGLPKAASMSHHRWYKAGLGMGVTAMRLNATDVLYCPLPLYHNNALTIAVSSVINCGGTLALSRKFSTSRFWSDIRKHGATSFIYVGELCRYLLNAPSSPRDQDHQVRVIIGNGVRPEIWQAFEQRFGIKHICEFYGASENTAAFVNVLNLKKTAGLSPMGYAVVEVDHDTEAPVKSPDGFLRKVQKGHTGLLITEVTATDPFAGYSDAQATEAKLFRNVFQTGDVWFNTGDLVRDQGFKHIAFVDRMGDTFRWKGENVATTEVEAVLLNEPDIAEAIVFGVRIPNTDGRAGMAAVTLKPDRALDGHALALRLEQTLPAYAVPLFIRLIKQAETTATFKVKKSDLKKQAFDDCQGDDVYVLMNKSEGYVPLTANRLASIQAGHTRF